MCLSPAGHASIYCFNNPCLECPKERGSPQGGERKRLEEGMYARQSDLRMRRENESGRALPYPTPARMLPGGGGCSGVLVLSVETRGIPLPSQTLLLPLLFYLFGGLLHLWHAGWVLQLRGCALRGRGAALPARAVSEGWVPLPRVGPASKRGDHPNPARETTSLRLPAVFSRLSWRLAAFGTPPRLHSHRAGFYPWR